MRRVFVALLLVLAACSTGDDQEGASRAPSPSTTSTTLSDPTTTTVAPDPPTTAPSGPAAAMVDGCPAVPPRATPDPDRPRYTIDAVLDLAASEVRGTVRVEFTPDQAIEQVVLRMWPNGPRLAGAGARGELPVVTVDGRHDPTHRPDATTWVVSLTQPVAAGRSVAVRADFVLELPGQANDRIARTGDAVRLGSFFPILPWEPGRGWATDPATAGFAEASTAPTADFDVRLEVPAGLTVMATGILGSDGRWTAAAVRDWAASVGRFRVVEAEVAAGRPVRVSVGVAEGVADDPMAYLDKLQRVLVDFAARFGPYPWPSYSLAITPGLRGGIEYPMHVLQGPGQIGRTTSHEVAHMWFYGLVGNNQGRDPVLDEGLATWGEARFEGTLDQLRNTSIPPDARGRAGESMRFWDQRLSSYYRGVYVQGAVALAALGPPEQVDCALRHFVAREAYDIAVPADLIASMQTVFPDAASVLARFGIAP